MTVVSPYEKKVFGLTKRREKQLEETWIRNVMRCLGYSEKEARAYHKKLYSKPSRRIQKRVADAITKMPQK